MDRAYLQRKDGEQTTCCWEAPSIEELKTLFDKTETPYEAMSEVEEHVTDSLE